MIDEQYEFHECIPITTGLKTIKIAYYFITKDEYDRNVIEAKTLDGIALQLIEIVEDKEHTKIPYQPDFNNQRKHPSDRQNQFVIAFIFLTRFSNVVLTSFVLLLIPIRYA